MTITVVQSVTAIFGNATSANPTLTGVTAGNAIVVVTFGAAFDTGGIPTISVSDGIAFTSLAQIVDTPVSSHYQIVDISLRTNVAGGTHNCVSTNTAGATECSGWATAIEVSGLANAATLDTFVTATSATGNPATGNTSVVVGTNEIAIASFSFRFNAASSITGPGGNWTNIVSEPDGTGQAAVGSVDYLTPVGLTAQSATYNPPTGAAWCAAIVVLKGVAVSSALAVVMYNGAILQLGGGAFSTGSQVIPPPIPSTAGLIKFNPGDWLASEEDENSTTTATWQSEISILKNNGTNINGYRVCKQWSSLENFSATTNGAFAAVGLTGVALQTAINTQYTGFADVAFCFYYLQALCPGKRLMIYINHHDISSFSGSFIQNNNFVTNPQVVPAWIANGGVVDSGSAGTLKIPDSYGASTTSLFSGPVDPFYSGSSYYGFAFNGLNGSGSTATMVYAVPVFWNPCVRQSMVQLVQAFFQFTLPAGAAYSGATAYTPGQVVTSGATSYICIANTTGNAPPNVTFWVVNTFAGQTFDQCQLFEMSGSNMEYSFDFTNNTNITGCLYQNPPHFSSGPQATRASGIAGTKALFKAWCAASPHTVADTCLSFSFNVQSPFDTPVTMGQYTNSLITGGNSDAFNTITGCALSNSNHYSLDFFNAFSGGIAWTATGPEQAYIGVDVPLNEGGGTLVPNSAHSLIGIMPKVDQHQEEDYGQRLLSGRTVNTTAVINDLIATDAVLGAQWRIWNIAASGTFDSSFWASTTYPAITANTTKAVTLRPTSIMTGVTVNSVSAVSSTSLTVFWTPFSLGPTETGLTYTIFRNGTSVATGQTSGTFTDTGLTLGTTYTYTIAMANSNGTGPQGTGVSGAPSNVGNFFSDPFSAFTSFIADTTFGGTNGASTTVSWNGGTLTAPTYSTLTAATNAATVGGGAGHRVCVLAGQTWLAGTNWSPPIAIPNLSGTSASSPFVIQGDPAASATTMPILNGNAGPTGGINLGSPPADGTGAPAANNFVTIRKLEITNFIDTTGAAVYGVSLANGGGGTYNGAVIEFCKLHLFRIAVGPGGSGPFYLSTPGSTDTFEVRYCKGYDVLMTDGTTQGRPFCMFNMYGGVYNIHHNEAFEMAAFMHFKVAPTVAPNGIIHHNYVHDCSQAFNCENGSESHGINGIQIYNNLFTWLNINNAVFGTPGNSQIFNDSGADGNTTAPTNVAFYNNTIIQAIGNASNPTYWNIGTTNVQIHDNIFLGNTPIVANEGGHNGQLSLCDFNVYFNPATFYLNLEGSPAPTFGSLAAWQGAHTAFPAIGGLLANPDLHSVDINLLSAPWKTIAANFPNNATNDYTIAAGSPLLTAGTGGAIPGYNSADIGPGW